MGASLKNTKYCVYISIILIFICLILFWMADPYFLRAPKDYYLLSLFKEKRNSFEALRRLTFEDSKEQWFFDNYNLGVNLGGARIKEYKKLISSIDSALNITVDDQSVRFHFASGGISVIGPGWYKGIEYIPGNIKREGTIVTDLDNLSSLPVGDVYLKEITPQWFIFFQNTD